MANIHIAFINPKPKTTVCKVRKLKKIVFVLVALLLIPIALAYPPRIAFETESSIDNQIIVKNPEISQAFYGELKDTIDYYQIKSDKEFNLYLEITVPDIPKQRTDFAVDIYQDGRLFKKIGSAGFEWTKFHEDFTGDDYLRGPSFEQKVPAGTYLIKVYNRDATGKYSLVIGKTESFTLKETAKTILAMPKIKSDFFGKPAVSAFFNLIGGLVLGGLILAGLLGYSVLAIWRKKK